MKLARLALVVLAAMVVGGFGGFFYLGYLSGQVATPALADGQLAPCPPSPNCVSSEASASGEHSVDPLASSSWSALPGAISALGGEVTESEADYIAAEFTSSLFRFVDDMQFRRASDVVHVRSASRVGYSDAGANRARVDALRAALAN